MRTISRPERKVAASSRRRVPRPALPLRTPRGRGPTWLLLGHRWLRWPPVGGIIRFNGTTHVGIVEVSCNETACVKLYNPTLRLCWDWFIVGLRALAGAR